jgi:hypothetical protein
MIFGAAGRAASFCKRREREPLLLGRLGGGDIGKKLGL